MQHVIHCIYVVCNSLHIAIFSQHRFALANLTTSSTFETRKLHSIISQLPHITTAKHFAATATF